MAMFTQYAIAAARMAIKDAQWENTTEDEKERTGVCLGSGIGSLDDMASTTLAYAENVSPTAMAPFFNFRDILAVTNLIPTYWIRWTDLFSRDIKR